MELVIGRLEYGPCSGSVYFVPDAVGLSNSVVLSKCVCVGGGEGRVLLDCIQPAPKEPFSETLSFALILPAVVGPDPF